MKPVNHIVLPEEFFNLSVEGKRLITITPGISQVRLGAAVLVNAETGQIQSEDDVVHVTNVALHKFYSIPGVILRTIYGTPNMEKALKLAQRHYPDLEWNSLVTVVRFQDKPEF